jgi:hypothetical protein
MKFAEAMLPVLAAIIVWEMFGRSLVASILPRS